MQYLYVVLLLVGLSQAAVQPSPVYRASPVVNPAATKRELPLHPTLPPQAEERESPAYGSTVDANKNVGVPGVSSNPVNSLNTGAKPAPSANGPNEQLFSVVYYPSGHPVGSGVQQPGANSLYSNPYQQQPYSSNGITAPGNSFLSQISWKDVVVGVTAVGLVAAGGAMWYPRLAGLRARAMRELSEMKSEDAARMAKSVMRAIQRFSEMNNANE